MAGQVPMTRPPGYADSFAQMLNNTASNKASILGSELEAQSSNLGHILGNITKIAEVGGGQFTPDRLLAAYAGSRGDIIDDNYSGMADRLRLAEQEANVARLNRMGTGGGGGGGGQEPKPFMAGTEDITITLKDGTRSVIRLREGDDLAKLMYRQKITPDMVQNIDYGVVLGPDNQPINGTGFRNPASSAAPSPNISYELTPEDLQFIS